MDIGIQYSDSRSWWVLFYLQFMVHGYSLTFVLSDDVTVLCVLSWFASVVLSRFKRYYFT